MYELGIENRFIYKIVNTFLQSYCPKVPFLLRVSLSYDIFEVEKELLHFLCSQFLLCRIGQYFPSVLKPTHRLSIVSTTDITLIKPKQTSFIKNYYETTIMCDECCVLILLLSPRVVVN